MSQSDPIENFRKECKFDWYTTGLHTDSLRITHLKSGNTVSGNTQGSHFKLQKKLIKELWIRCNSNENA